MTEHAGTGGVVPSATGDPQVDGILAILDGLTDRPVSEHADVYLELLGRLGGELNPEQKLRQAGAHGAS
ncbi:hypothetical protein GM708_17565 [Vibrio cholerae]|jgi:hypothetical protein|nr:hypothetical protein [Vibrio cholerae]